MSEYGITICDLFSSSLSGSNDFMRESVDCSYRRDESNPKQCGTSQNPVEERSLDDELPRIIFRFKFTEDFMEELYKFSKIHQYDDRKDFKEAWTKWTEENDEIIDEETKRLIQLGYDGDILVKMFKSARYYFRKKSDQKREPKQRRAYISVNRELLNAMDRHILENIYMEDYQPKNGFESFCKDNETILQTTISQIVENGVHDKETIDIKIKKTYKNRYFLLTNK
jgi:hypothetical protein